MPEAFPAVTTPSRAKTGGSLASDCTVVLARGCSSADRVEGPLRDGLSGRGVSSEVRAPEERASAYRVWDWRAYADSQLQAMAEELRS